MTDLMVNLIYRQVKREPAGMEFTNIDNNTTLNEYEERGSDSDSDFEDNNTTVNNYKEYGNDSDSDFKDDNKSYETSNDSILNEDHKLIN